MTKRQELIELATPLFLQVGFKALTVDELAANLSISKKTIYKYFSSKDELVSAVIDNNLAYFEQIYEHTEAQTPNCVEQIKLFFRLVENEFGFLQFRINYVEMADYYPAMFKKASEMLHSTTVMLLKRIILRAESEGFLDEKVDIDSTSNLLALLYVKLGTTFDKTNVDGFNKLLNEYIYLVFKSILNEKGQEEVGEKVNFISKV